MKFLIMMSHNHEAWDAFGEAEREATFEQLGKFRAVEWGKRGRFMVGANEVRQLDE